MAKYDPRTRKILDQVLEDYGLIVCGWSATWDIALRSSMEKRRNRRFTTFWAYRSDFTDEARHLVDLLKVVKLRIDSADTFFADLDSKVDALESRAARHPITSEIIIESVKKYLSEDKYRIRLTDLVTRTTENAFGRLRNELYSFSDPDFSSENIQLRMSHFESDVSELLHAFAVGAYFSAASHAEIWARTFARISSLRPFERAFELWRMLDRYPALMLLYVGGVASTAAGNFALLKQLFYTRIESLAGRRDYASVLLNCPTVLSKAFEAVESTHRQYVPGSELLYRVTREYVREFLPEEDLYEAYFDRFEYLLALSHFDLSQEDRQLRVWVPPGRFAYRHAYQPESQIMNKVNKELDAQGAEWPPLREGMYHGSLERLREVKIAVDEFIESLHWMR